MLEVDAISKSYNHHIIQSYSKIFEDSKLYVITGPNASGKSTFLKLLGGAVRYDSGRLIIDEIDEKTDKIGYRMNISTHFAETNLFPLTTPKDFWDFHFNSFGIDTPMAELLSLADKFDLIGDEQFIQNEMHTLSSGTKRKIFLLACLLRDAKVYLLDEPDNNLDAKSQLLLLQLIKDRLDRGSTVILVTHSEMFLQLLDEVIDYEHINWQLGMTSEEYVR